jgi:hypothetical protein
MERINLENILDIFVLENCIIGLQYRLQLLDSINSENELIK